MHIYYFSPASVANRRDLTPAPIPSALARLPDAVCPGPKDRRSGGVVHHQAIVEAYLQPVFVGGVHHHRRHVFLKRRSRYRIAGVLRRPETEAVVVFGDERFMV